ncbi:MAG: RIP metalloprotease RseP [Paracoccaceae bacterium]
MDIAGLLPTFGGFFLTALAFLAALSVIVTVHEYGHYIVGRWSGIHAEVFSLGFGPTLWSRTDRHGTRWQVASIPLGGFVKFLGDANAASAGADEAVVSQLSPKELRHTMHGAPLWARAATVAAGPVFNFALSLVLFAALAFWTGVATDAPTIGKLKDLPTGSYDILPGDTLLQVNGKDTPDWEQALDDLESLPSTPSLPYLINRDGQVMEVKGPAFYPPLADVVAQESAGQAAGLQVGDVIISIDGAPVHTFSDLQEMVKAGQGAAVDLVVWRAGQEMPFRLTPKIADVPLPEGGFEKRYLIGLIGGPFFEPATRSVGAFEAVSLAGRQTWGVMTSAVSGIANLIVGNISSCNMRGPLTIAKTSAHAASEGPSDFIWFIAFLSTAVGLLNLFPIPALDGGHLVFYCYEWAAGRPLPARALNIFLTLGIFAVLAITLFGLSNDIFCP